MADTTTTKKLWEAGQISDVEALMHLADCHAMGEPKAFATMVDVILWMNQQEKAWLQQELAEARRHLN